MLTATNQCWIMVVISLISMTARFYTPSLISTDEITAIGLLSHLFGTLAAISRGMIGIILGISRPRTIDGNGLMAPAGSSNLFIDLGAEPLFNIVLNNDLEICSDVGATQGRGLLAINIDWRGWLLTCPRK